MEPKRCNDCNEELTEKNRVTQGKNKNTGTIYYRGDCKKCVADKRRAKNGWKKYEPVTHCKNEECGVLLDESNKAYITIRGITSYRGVCYTCLLKYNREWLRAKRALTPKKKTGPKPKPKAKVLKNRIKKVKTVIKQTSKRENKVNKVTVPTHRLNSIVREKQAIEVLESSNNIIPKKVARAIAQKEKRVEESDPHKNDDSLIEAFLKKNKVTKIETKKVEYKPFDGELEQINRY